MEQNQSEKEEKNEPSDQLVKLGQNLICGKEDHYFEYKSGTEVMCRKCPLGYPIGAGTECREGRIYIHGERVL